MKPQYAIALAVVAGFGAGAIAVHGLHAQANPPVYVITEVEVSNSHAYANEYVPKIQAIYKAAGARYFAVGGTITPIEGAPPKSRVIITAWDSIEKYQAVHNSAEYKKARTVGDKYAKYRSFAVEGISQ
jgi:uncharacterized protein (DUF1330 family)